MELRAAPYPYSKMCELCELCELFVKKSHRYAMGFSYFYSAEFIQKPPNGGLFLYAE